MTRTKSVAEAVPLHRGPEFNLAVEPWIPVMRDGEQVQVSLGDLLREAHWYDHLACDDPLVEEAMLRLLIQLTHIVIANGNLAEADIEDIGAGKAPLPVAGVEVVLERFAERLWLWHPETPFLQHPDLRTAVSAPVQLGRDGLPKDTKWCHGVETLSPHAQSGSSVSIFYAQGVADTALEPALAARYLVLRHFAGTPGNEQMVAGSKFTQGGLIVAGRGRHTHFFHTGTTVAATLVRNLLRTHAPKDPAAPTFFEAPQAAAKYASDPFYLYGATDAAAFLIQPAPGQPVRKLLRGRVPADREVQKVLIDAARLSDPHTVRWVSKTQKTVRIGKSTKLLLDPAAGQCRNLAAALARTVTNGLAPFPSVLDRTLWVDAAPRGRKPMRVFTLETSGTSGLVVQGAAAFQWSPEAIVAPAGQQMLVAQIYNSFAGSSSSAASRLRYAVRRAVASDGREGIGAAEQLAEDVLWGAAEPVLADVTRQVLDGRHTAGVLPNEARDLLVGSVMNAYRTAVQPYAHSQRVRVQIEKVSAQLSGQVRQQLGAGGNQHVGTASRRGRTA